jgi:hypothetical protein
MKRLKDLGVSIKPFSAQTFNQYTISYVFQASFQHFNLYAIFFVKK